jgi:uncharacterized membrane protein
MSQQNDSQETARRSTDYRVIILGAVGSVLLLAWLLNTPPGLLGKTDAIGYAVCHRISSHSFYIEDRPFSLCARCSGQYMGFLFGFLFQLVVGKSRAGFPKKHILIFFVLAALIYFVDGTNSVLHLYPGLDHLSIYEPQNQLRLFTGLFFGLSISAVVFPLAAQSVWRNYSLEPVIKERNQWLIFIGGAILLGMLTLSGNSSILFILNLISTAGLITLLTVLYTVIWLLIMNRQNQIETWAELRKWIVGGGITALTQIMAIDAIRFFLTGSWSGFLDY